MKESMYDWLFHYNPYMEVWTAFKRENKEKYFNGELEPHEFHRSSKITTLIEFLNKSGK